MNFQADFLRFLVHFKFSPSPNKSLSLRAGFDRGKKREKIRQEDSGANFFFFFFKLVRSTKWQIPLVFCFWVLDSVPPPSSNIC
jgi:hypothetical protein